MNKSNYLFAYLILIIATALWGGNIIAAKVVAFSEALSENFMRYVLEVKKNANIMGDPVLLSWAFENILKNSDVELKKRAYILLDLMATDKGDVIIGVPDVSGTPERTIAIWIKNKEFAESLITSLTE